MAQVLIRNLSERVIRTHRERAVAHGRSLEQGLRDVIERAATYAPEGRYTPEERLAAALRFQGLTPPGPRSDPAELIGRDRDR